MTENRDEYDGLRRALRTGAGFAPTAVDPAAARRAGDSRARTRTAITTSLAFSLVIFAGLGSVFFAAHRSRPSSLGSDVVTSTPGASPSPTAPVQLVAYFQTTPPLAGVPDVLHLSGPGNAFSHYAVTWGDGTTAGTDAGSLCKLALGERSSDTVSHTYATAGMKLVVVNIESACGVTAQTISFRQLVLPGAAPSPHAYVPPPVLRVGPTPSTAASRSVAPSEAVSVSPTATPTGRVARTGTPIPTVSATATPTGSATPTGTPTAVASRSAKPSRASASPPAVEPGSTSTARPTS